MDGSLVRKLFALFTNTEEDEVNILDWNFNGERLLIKAEDPVDGMVEVHELSLRMLGYSSSLDFNNFDVVETDDPK